MKPRTAEVFAWVSVVLAFLSLAGCVGVLIGLLSACDVPTSPSDVVEPDDVVGIAEEYCKANPTLPCGKVYAFPDVPRENPIGMLEMCIPQFLDGLGGVSAEDVSFAEAEFGPAVLSPSPRFADANLCWWCAGTGCTRGCNAYDGCYVPAGFMPPDAGVDAP